MASPEAVPVHDKTSRAQRVTQSFGTGIWQDRILQAMALKHRQTLAFRHERSPDRLSQVVPRELDQSGKRMVAVQHRIAGQHGALREPSDDRLLVIDRQMARHVL